ncbi:hypothetical protein RvY_01178-2 [Ramazzottius varieornatus]|uniref:Uncharacterized protein n=1 Tax=Ramazzottius varieornatus TaxID=947166 RepID=A0A1D1UFR6_RAMVA|nr:hypothetical protein RvY_01178-2 [Ramazzottius varieornatus]
MSCRLYGRSAAVSHLPRVWAAYYLDHGLGCRTGEQGRIPERHFSQSAGFDNYSIRYNYSIPDPVLRMGNRVHRSRYRWSRLRSGCSCGSWSTSGVVSIWRHRLQTGS